MQNLQNIAKLLLFSVKVFLVLTVLLGQAVIILQNDLIGKKVELIEFQMEGK